MVEFTYDSYFEHVKLLLEKGYKIVSYGDKSPGKKVILRHDVDFSLKKSAELAKKEAESGFNIKSVYYVLLRTNFYNVFSHESAKYIREILDYGHEVGLHFDETFYSFNSKEEFKEAVHKEAALLEQVTGEPVTSVSMHRPSKFVLEGDIQFDGIINSYSQEYFKEWKYVSDARMNWREDLDEIVECGQHEKIQIVTHAFWYADQRESTKDKLMKFISEAKEERYYSVNNNFRNLAEFIAREDVV